MLIEHHSRWGPISSMDIKEDEIEWAIVQRTMELLDVEAKHDITLTFNLFLGLILWPREAMHTEKKAVARGGGLEALSDPIVGQPWKIPYECLSGNFNAGTRDKPQPKPFIEATGWEFLIFLRNCAAHGPSAIKPLNSSSSARLLGFSFLTKSKDKDFGPRWEGRADLKIQLMRQRLGHDLGAYKPSWRVRFSDEKMLDSVGLAGPKNQPLPTG
jgi:hypothetical protein